MSTTIKPIVAINALVESKRKLAKAKTCKAIMKSALRLYSLEGSYGMSMNKVAKGAGIAQPSFYNHFISLDALQNELSIQLKDNYLSAMRNAWIAMLKDYPWLTKAQFNQRCQHCLGLIFDAAFVNIDLFQRLIEDRLRGHSSSDKGGFNTIINDIQREWTQIFIQGLTLSERPFKASDVNLCVDIASAQVHELILGCHQQRYSRAQAIGVLSQNFDRLFASFFDQTSFVIS